MIIGSLSVILALVVILLVPMFSDIALRTAGFEPIKTTNTPTIATAIPISGAVEASATVRVSAGAFGQLDLSTDSIEIGSDDAGAEVAQAVMRADDIQELCVQYTDYCGDKGKAFRRAKVTIGDSSMVIASEAFVDILNIWQPLELQLSLSADNAIQIDNVNIDGRYYSLPDNALGQNIQKALKTANQILKLLSVEAEGKTYQLFDIVITENQLVATFRRRDRGP